MQQLILKEFFLQKKMFPFYFYTYFIRFKNSVEPMGIAIGLFITCSTIIYISFIMTRKVKQKSISEFAYNETRDSYS